MNIVKIKDILLDNESSLKEEQMALFNESFRGKYVNAINWTYCIPIEELSATETVDVSQSLTKIVDDRPVVLSNENPLEGHKWLLLNDIISYIDEIATEEANKTTKYEAFNANLHTDKLTWEDVRYFRTWLATLLYDSQIIDDYKTNEMLKYYKNEMVDETVKHLKEFTDVLASTLVTTSSCGCGSSISASVQNQSTTGVTILQGASTSCGCGGMTLPVAISDLCDPLEKYRSAMRAFMISIFSDMDFWLKYDKAFLLEIKKYIDAIIDFNPAFNLNNGIDILRNCVCEDQTLQGTAIQILRNVSLAFQYMGTDDLTDHKNFIITSLNTWATTLYEKMIWK